MATYPPHGLTSWDDELQSYIDDKAAEEADGVVADATAAATAAGTAAGTTAGNTAGAAAGLAAVASPVAQAQAAATTATASATSASASASLAMSAALDAVSIVIADEDEALAAAISSPTSQTNSALSASYVRFVNANTGAQLAGGKVTVKVDPISHEITDILWEA